MRLITRDDAKILIIRPDRIGDVVLSTPVLTSIRRARPGWKISVLVKPLVAPLLEGHPDVDEVIRLDTSEKPSFSNTRGLAGRIRSGGFDAAVHLFSDFWISLAVWRAGVPWVAGPASKIAAIFYDERVVQNRSKGGRHEADHNLDLLAPLGIPPIRKTSVAADKGFAPPPGLLAAGKRNVGVFPGMGGSARNWKPANFARLADVLAGEGMNVVLICGPGGEPLLSEVWSLTKSTPARFVCPGPPELASFINTPDCEPTQKIVITQIKRLQFKRRIGCGHRSSRYMLEYSVQKRRQISRFIREFQFCHALPAHRVNYGKIYLFVIRAQLHEQFQNLFFTARQIRCRFVYFIYNHNRL